MIDPGFISRCESWPADILRERRQEAETFEYKISYTRRLLQGGIDILEAHLRADDQDCTKDPLASVKEAISGSLEFMTSRAAYTDVSTAFPLPTALEISQFIGFDIEVVLDQPENIQTNLDKMKAAEVLLSRYRRDLHKVIDALRHEFVIRYQRGQINSRTIN